MRAFPEDYWTHHLDEDRAYQDAKDAEEAEETVYDMPENTKDEIIDKILAVSVGVYGDYNGITKSSECLKMLCEKLRIL